MTHEDWLRTLAEVAVALAGFSGLLAGIRQRNQRESQINLTRLKTIVETSLSVLAFCLMPVFLKAWVSASWGPFGFLRSSSSRDSSPLLSWDFAAFVLRQVHR